MLKRNITPSFSHRIGNIPHPKINKNAKEKSKLILPILKNNLDDNSLKNNNISKNHFNSKMFSSKENRKNRLNINNSKKNLLSPINTELNKNRKRSSYVCGETKDKYSKFKLNIKEKSINQIINIKKNDSKDNNSRDINNFNKNIKKNISNITTDFLPILCNNKKNIKLKCPSIETNISQMKCDKKVDSMSKYKGHHKYKSDDALLESEYNFQLKKDATYSKKGTER